MAGALTTVTAGISALSSDKDARKPYLDGPISIEHNLIRMSGVRDALELGLIYPCSTPTMDMVSDLNTKACNDLYLS